MIAATTRLTLILLLQIFVLVGANGQTKENSFFRLNDTAQKKEQLKATSFRLSDTAKKLPVKDYSISLGLGTTGIGIEGSKKIDTNELISIYAGLLSYHVKFKHYFGSTKVLSSPSFMTPVISIGYNWFAWRNKSTSKEILKHMKLKTGIQYMVKPEINFTSKSGQDLTYGMVNLLDEELGRIYTKITGNKWQPYLSLGYDSFFKPNKWSLGVDAGMMYVGKLHVDVEATNLLEPTEVEAGKIESNLRSYQILPYIALRLQVKL